MANEEKSNKLGIFQARVLKVVLNLGKDQAYGVPIHEAIEKATQQPHGIGAIYTTLGRLEDKGFVHSWTGSSTKERGGRAKRYYEVTGAGEQALEQMESINDNLRSLPRPEFGIV